MAFSTGSSVIDLFFLRLGLASQSICEQVKLKFGVLCANNSSAEMDYNHMHDKWNVLRETLKGNIIKYLFSSIFYSTHFSWKAKNKTLNLTWLQFTYILDNNNTHRNKHIKRKLIVFSTFCVSHQYSNVIDIGLGDLDVMISTSTPFLCHHNDIYF